LAKTMTAVKLAAFLSRSGLPAVPVCVVFSGPANGEPTGELGFLDQEGRFRECAVSLERGSRDEWRVSRSAVEWLNRIALSLGSHSSAAPLLDLARGFYREGTPIKKAWSGLMRGLFQHATIAILDFDHISPAAVGAALDEGFGAEAARTFSDWSIRMRRAGYELGADWLVNESAEGFAMPDGMVPMLLSVLLLPAAAASVDSSELPHWSALAALCRSAHRYPPQIWPRASFTVVDSRSRKLMNRYRIPPDLLYEGAAALLDRVLPEADGDEVFRAVGRLRDAVETRARTLRDILGSEALAASGMERSIARIQYQLEKLAERSRKHRARRIGVLEDRFERLCAKLAPQGCLQESRLAALQVLAQGSEGIVERLSESMDITLWEHQFLNLD
jgi:hypothetical protein